MTTNEPSRPRPLLKWLRIGITAVGLLLSLTMISLWVRSYFYLDWYERPIGGIRTIQIVSFGGRFQISTESLIRSTVVFNDPWGWHSLRVNSPANLYDSAQPASTSFSITFNSIDNWSLAVPHWLLGVIGGICATLPWVKWARRFSLRTLLVLTTLVALLLGALTIADRVMNSQ